MFIQRKSGELHRILRLFEPRSGEGAIRRRDGGTSDCEAIGGQSRPTQRQRSRHAPDRGCQRQLTGLRAQRQRADKQRYRRLQLPKKPEAKRFRLFQ